MDPHAENYLPISPYAYVGNNPIIYIDPDGRDRRLIYNHSNKTITVKATYYHSIGATKSARAGVRVFNNMEGVTYKDKGGTAWNVKFDLTTQRSNDPDYAAQNNPQGNSFELKETVISSESGKKVAGTATNQKYIDVGVEFKDELTPAHEIGHTLGMANRENRGDPDNHSETGIMTPYTNHPERSENLEQENINQMIETGRGPEEHRISVIDQIKIILPLLLP